MITINDNLKINAPKPTDERQVVGSLVDRDNLIYLYEGLVTWVSDIQKEYRYTNAQWIEVTSGDSSTGLEKITEGGNTGLARVGRVAANYGDIGQDAVDLSTSTYSSGTQGATGDYSVAIGKNVRASGASSFAEGDGSIASGSKSHAEGSSTAIGTLSHAEGQGCTATGLASHAEGNVTQAIGSSSHSEGYMTIANNSNQHVAGNYNKGTSATTIHETGIGIGTGDKRNAFEIHTNGTVLAPEQTIALTTQARQLITKEYVDRGVPILVTAPSATKIVDFSFNSSERLEITSDMAFSSSNLGDNSVTKRILITNTTGVYRSVTYPASWNFHTDNKFFGVGANGEVAVTITNFGNADAYVLITHIGLNQLI
jgi:hypothetical protein